MKLQFKEIAFLLAADVGQEAEGRMMRAGYPLKSNLLKVPHHGSASSSSPYFLEKVNPRYAILSVGERNIARLPHPEVMHRYRQIGSTLYRTDRQGAITVTADGEKIQIRPFLNKEKRPPTT